MKIGCVKEIKNNEFRVGITPDMQDMLFILKRVQEKALVLQMKSIRKQEQY